MVGGSSLLYSPIHLPEAINKGRILNKLVPKAIIVLCPDVSKIQAMAGDHHEKFKSMDDQSLTQEDSMSVVKLVE